MGRAVRQAWGSRPSWSVPSSLQAGRRQRQLRALLQAVRGRITRKGGQRLPRGERRARGFAAQGLSSWGCSCARPSLTAVGQRCVKPPPLAFGRTSGAMMMPRGSPLAVRLPSCPSFQWSQSLGRPPSAKPRPKPGDSRLHRLRFWQRAKAECRCPSEPHPYSPCFRFAHSFWAS